VDTEGGDIELAFSKRRYFLGVDGGQSTTTALVGDETGRVLGAGSGGPCNHVGAAEGRGKLLNAVRECVGKACTAAGIDFASVTFEAACFGMSGGSDDKQAILATILRAERLEVSNDAVIALAGATGGDPGMIAIAGTGSIGLGRNGVGRTARAGGWGYVFGDEGGGFDITRQALRAILRHEEGWGPPTALRETLLAATGATSANDLLHRFYTQEWPRPRIAALSRLVDDDARAGDAVARDILLNAAQQLASMTASVRAQLWRPGEEARVAYVGGVFRSALLLERYRMLVELEEGNRVGPPQYGPAAGALLEAYRAAGLRPPLSNLPEFKA
jgi:N-acetylglucosamine kinase-like BadF-type ATPase